MSYEVPNGSSSTPEQYFAAKAPDQLASILLGKGRSFFNLLESNAYLEKLNNMWRAYHGDYGNDLDYGHRLNFVGEQGEYVNLIVNHFRNLAQHMYVIVTANRPVMEARAINTDYKSMAQTYLANGILDYYMREKNLEDCLKKACEMSIVIGAGFIKLAWNATAGETFDADPDTGEIAYEGELEFTNLSPFDVVMDGTKETWNNEWIMTRSFENRFNLMAKYPELASKIQAIPSKSSSAVYRLGVWSNDDTDDIPVYEFFHKRTEAMPDGRYLLFLDATCVLLDTKMPYRNLPVFRIVPDEIMGTPYGYTPMFDILPLQEAMNALYSTVMTNNNAFGVQNLWVPPGSNISVTTLAGALNVIESEIEPKALQLTASSPETFKFIDMLVQASETISGINSVARGNPEASLKSGTALALVQSMALQFISGLQQSYVKLIEDVGTATINILKDFAKTPKIAALVGKNNRTFLKEYTGEDISAISRVVIDVGNPLSRCLAYDTPVLMFDGSIKMVQDIKIGEQVMGPDSYPRTVGNVNSGQEMMYEITSKDKHRDIKYGCNESHILTLKYCSDDYRYDAKQGDILDITVGDYLKLTDRQKRLLQGFTVGVEFEKKELPIPPYILGSWLGDGNSRASSITTMDQEMVDVWTNYADQIGMQVRIQENRQPNKSKNYFITSGEQFGKSDRNPFMNSLRELELIQNKHIPNCYLRTNKADRLQLLAGLIDTDGHRIDETFIFTQKNERLSKEVVFLAKSLGFRVTCKKVKSNSSKLVGEIDSEIYKVSIGGDTWEIPTKLPRKMATKKEKARNPLNYGINVECKGKGTYYGFTLIEEPHFLLGDFTVTHNTIAGRVQMAEQLLQMKAIEDPNQYFQVLNTGRLDAMYEGEMIELMLMKAENEKLMGGEKVIVSPLDQHKEHILEHKAVLADPDLRSDPVLIKNCFDHIQDHLNALRNTDPGLLQLTNQQPLPPVQPPGQGANAPQPNQGGPPPGQQNATPGVLKKSPIPNVTAPNAGLAQPGQPVQGPGQQGQALPAMPKPPKPFQHNPTNPEEMG